MTELQQILSDFSRHKESALSHRYITLEHIEPLIKNLPNSIEVLNIGRSVEERTIYALKLGSGEKRILMWSQMHGNESTTTKATFDLINTFTELSTSLLDHCELVIVPLLNPDGAKNYTRENANQVDLNRDAQALSQPESRALRQLFDRFQPHYCFNLHGQRTIFSAGQTSNVATLSFLAPAEDESRTVTETRKKAMRLIVEMNDQLQQLIPNQIGIYDDAYNINCVGDTFQSQGVPTILFEAGHYANDYAREEVRRLLYTALRIVLTYIAENEVTAQNFEAYFDIPENQKLFYDIIIRQAKIDQEIKDIAIQYDERLLDGRIEFKAMVKCIGELSKYYAHQTIAAHGAEVTSLSKQSLQEGDEIDCVIINDEKYALKVE